MSVTSEIKTIKIFNLLMCETKKISSVHEKKRFLHGRLGDYNHHFKNIRYHGYNIR